VHVTLYLHNVSTDVSDVALEALRKEFDHLSEEVERFALLAINIPPPKVLKEHSPADKLLDHYPDNMELSYEKLYDPIRLLEGEIYNYATQAALNINDETILEKLNMVVRQTSYLATAAKAIKDMLEDIGRLYMAESHEEQTFLRNLRYQILKSVEAFNAARGGDGDAQTEMERIYKRIAKSYRDNMGMIRDISKNRKIPTEMTTIAVNDMHLSKSFSKSLRNILRSESAMPGEESEKRA
jgi:phosphate:Na+ symporter